MVRATVREWHNDLGWGVLDSPETPGGCWIHYSAIETRLLAPVEGTEVSDYKGVAEATRSNLSGRPPARTALSTEPSSCEARSKSGTWTHPLVPSTLLARCTGDRVTVLNEDLNL